jgi:hypothetical protein
MGRAEQAAEKLDFSKCAKNEFHQDAPGAIRESCLMVFHPADFALSPSVPRFSAACKAVRAVRRTDSDCAGWDRVLLFAKA